MARYVIANRRAGKFTADTKARSRAEMMGALSFLPVAQIVKDHNPEDPLARRVTVVEADPAEMVRKAESLSHDVIVEPEILHWPDTLPPRDLQSLLPGQPQPLAMALAAAAFGEPTILRTTGGGRALPNAEIKLYLRSLGGSVSELTGRSDTRGECRFQLRLGDQPAAVLVIPSGGFWPMVARGTAVRAPIDCPPLPADGPLGWWHSVVGVGSFDPRRGAGIKVGVADTGVGSHPNLRHAILVGAYVGGEVLPPEAAADVAQHGTHVAGTIGARPTRAGDYAGVAPGCELYAARVFAGPESGASNADIANAIDALSREHGVDLINLSLGATTPSEVVRDAIIDAAERGTLCICAAGNNGGDVIYPAAFPEAVAVAAVGLVGWGPPGSLSATRLPLDAGLFGQRDLYAANFTSHGAQTACAGPGVGILATVPNHFGADPLYGAMDGTSMASPAACGALAAVLSRNAEYNALPRDSVRQKAGRALLVGALRDIGLPSTYQGRGIPSVD